MSYRRGNEEAHVSGDFPSDVELPKVEIHATDVCNNRCSFCTTGWLMREQGEDLGHPPRAVLRRQLEEAYANGARRALFRLLLGEDLVRAIWPGEALVAP